MADDRTRRMDPAPPPGERETVREEVERGPTRLELADEARANRKRAIAATVLGALAAAAATAALVLALTDEDRSADRGGASSGDVQELRDDVGDLRERVDQLEDDTEGAGELQDRVEELEGRVGEVDEQQDELAGQVEELDGQVDDAASRLGEALEGGQDGGTATTP